MTAYNRYGCVPGVRCNCPRSFATCSARNVSKGIVEYLGEP